MGKASSGGCPIVILAEKDKEEMEEAIASFDIDMHGSTVLCRNGDPLMRAEQVKVSAQFARYGNGCRRHELDRKVLNSHRRQRGFHP